MGGGSFQPLSARGNFGGRTENFPDARRSSQRSEAIDPNPIYWRSCPMRLLALALAFVFAGAPIAAEVCETTCSVEHCEPSESFRSGSRRRRDSSTTGDARHHVATQKTGSPDGILATSVSHGCCYAAAVLTDSRDSKRGTAPSAALMTALTGAMPVGISQRARVSHRHRPPALSRPSSQLRVFKPLSDRRSSSSGEVRV